MKLFFNPSSENKSGISKSNLTQKISSYLFIEKLGYLGLFLVLSVFSLMVWALILKFNIVGIILLAALVIGLPVFIITIFNLKAGLIIFTVISFFLLIAMRFVDLPLGVLMDILIVSMFFGVLLQQAYQKNWKILNNPVTYMIVVWLLYSLLQVLNPWAASKLAWVYTIRSTALLMLIYFVAIYAFDKVSYLKLFLIVWIGLAVLAALYGLYQEFFGLLDYDLKWVHEDEDRYKLYFNWGRYRKFSYLNNPTVFGILMSHSALLCFVLAFRDISLWKKAVLLFFSLLMAWSMIYSGTRTSIAMLPAGLFFFIVLNFEKKSIIFGALLFFIGTLIIVSPIKSLGPISSNNLERIRSTFKTDEDPSYIVRMKNQEFIKPFILSHPIGAGLGSVGVWGQRFSPDSPLAKFPPDSGYVRVAVELGYIGLFIFCGLLFATMYVGIMGYKTVKSPGLKNYYAALLTVLYSLIVANYPQEAIIMFPTLTIFYVLMGLMVSIKYLDNSVHQKQ